MNKREIAREKAKRERLKDWVIFDPFTASGAWSSCVGSHATEAEAERALATYQADDPDGFDGCVVVPKAEFIENNLAYLGGD